MEKIVIFLFSIFIFVACKELPITPLGITKSLSLVQEKKIIDNGYGYGTMKDSLLTFLAYSDPEEKFIHIYDTSLNLKLTIGDKGKLFSEFNMPELFNNSISSSDSMIHLYDINLLQEKYFIPQNLISNPHADEEIKGQYLPTKLYFTNNLNSLSDSIIIGQSIEMNKGVYFMYNKNTNKMKWVKFNHRFRYPDKRYEDHSYLSSICVHFERKRIMVVYRYFDLIQLYDGNGELLKELCFSKIQKPLLSTKNSCMAPEALFYNLSICGTNEYCYVLRANKTLLELQNENEEAFGELIVVDWDGNIKNIYESPTFLHSITVDIDNTFLYATKQDYNNPEYSFIQKYRL